MRQMVVERSIHIEYNAKFKRIVSETTSGVDFLVNGDTCHASLLIGMDGIHSQVRQYLAPSVTPEYMGTTGVLCHIKRSSVDWPYEDYEWNATIQDKPGAIFFIAEDPEGEDIMIGKQQSAQEYSRDELEDLQKDKDKLASFYTERYDEWGETARQIIDQVVANKQELFIWPFVKVPTLSKWYSDSGRVLLCGDGAHGLPPSSGQGINQALEDIHTLILLLVQTGRGSKIDLLDVLQYWQTERQKRIDAVFDWATNTTNVARMSEAERAKVVAAGRVVEEKKPEEDMRWLYEPTLEGHLEEWIRERS